MGVDYGTKRIGLAISDGLGLTAQGLDTLERTDTEEDITVLADLVRQRGVEEIVVGRPNAKVGLSGQHCGPYV